ncbi:hypothetical protein HS088_TW21G00792 [Tripterygium wilfordii]|uniref:Ribosomal RNA-processing protein 17 n=1 Tax=Tripterygium wilfordii TaxID=458696 RepID=A0A7J7C3E8_TRIWF|nr:ribosomal RNA-processing protein 17 [Tripterygium wilfordii]KAF5728643.1 hypothetical protein HS088_TW21G00792 [Tripterygium wilfordii]
MEEGGPEAPPTRVRHINKRALKNKALSVSFNEKDLKDYVTGFHKRKKKRRKEAERQQEEAERRKRIEKRKKMKLERQLVYGGAPPATGSDADGSENDLDLDEGVESVTPVNGMTMYDNGDMKITVKTSEISREDDDRPHGKTDAEVPRSIGVDKKNNLPVSKKKSFKKVAKHRPRSNKLQKKRDKKKGKKKNKKH